MRKLFLRDHRPGNGGGRCLRSVIAAQHRVHSRACHDSPSFFPRRCAVVGSKPGRPAFPGRTPAVSRLLADIAGLWAQRGRLPRGYSPLRRLWARGARQCSGRGKIPKSLPACRKRENAASLHRRHRSHASRMTGRRSSPDTVSRNPTSVAVQWIRFRVAHSFSLSPKVGPYAHSQPLITPSATQLGKGASSALTSCCRRLRQAP